MNESAPTWSTLRELVAVVVAPQHLKRTVSVMLVVGTAFFAMNQLGVILAGRASVLVWVKAVADLPDAASGLELRAPVGHPQKCRPLESTHHWLRTSNKSPKPGSLQPS